MQPQNGLIGDTYGTDLPQMQVEEDTLKEEKRMAKYSRSAEFKRIREHFEAKVAYYQQFLPGNVPVEQISEEERGKYWAVANIVIKEFNEVINMFELAKTVVDEENKNNG